MKLSFSQVQTWLRCPRMWALRYLLGLKIPPPGAALIGRLTEKALRKGLEPVLREKRPEPLEVVEDFFREQFKETKDLADWGEDKPEKMFSGARVALVGYYHEVVPSLRPISIQEKAEAEIPGGVRVVGIADLREPGVVVDWKTTKKRLTPNRALEAQLYTYRALWRDSNALYVHNLVLGKAEPGVIAIEVSEDPECVWRLYQQVAAAIRWSLETGIFLPASLDHWICSPKWCGYYYECHKRDWRPEPWLERLSEVPLRSEDEEIEW